MPSPARQRLVLAGLVVLATVAVGLVASRAFHHDSRIERALATLPAQTLVANFTDWAAIREQLGPEVTSRSAERTRAELFDRAYDRDYTTTSVLNVFDRDMAPTYGWTVLDSEWEMYGQSKDGAVEVLLMPEDFDFEDAGQALTDLGYSDADHGVRVADDQALAAIANGLTPQLTAIGFVPDEQLIVMSDVAAYADLTVDTIRGDDDPAFGRDGVAEMAAALGDTSVSALVDVGDYACDASSFTDADPAQRELARQRIEAVGDVEPLHGLTRSIDAASRLTVVMDFASAATAKHERDRRVALAKGDAPDQGGTFDERFRIDSADVHGEVLVLVLAPRSSDTQLLRDLGRGGLLFAAC